MGGCKLVLSGSGNTKVAGCGERRNEPSSSKKYKEFAEFFFSRKNLLHGFF
jgi:hypothetical protein